MTGPTTVLGAQVPTVDAPDSGALTVAIVDIDDFEVMRLARGDCWGDAQLAGVGRVLRSLAADAEAALTFVRPDAWIVALGSDSADDLVARAVSLAQHVCAEVAKTTDVTVSIGVSRAHSGATRMESALAEAVSGIERKLIDPGNRVTVYDCRSANCAKAEPERIEQELARAIRDSDVQQALQVLSGWIDRIAAAEAATPDVLRRWVTAEIMYALDVSGRRRLADGSVDWFDAFSRLSLEELMEMSAIHDRSYLLLWLQRLLDRIVDVNTTTSAGRHVLALVEKYIDEHFADDLRLSTLAAEVYVSPYYISHLFQRERGTTFLKYLTGVRMQRARELLADTDVPVEAVSARVGYGSSKRFRTLFKRTFKVSPSEYRNQHQRRSLRVS